MSEIDQAIDSLNSGQQMFVAHGVAAPTGEELQSGDHIFLATFSNDVDSTPLEIAKTLAQHDTGNHIFGVVVGNNGVGYSTFLSNNMAGETFEKAINFSNTPQGAQDIFVRLIHRYSETEQGQADFAKLTTTSTKTNNEVPSTNDSNSGIGAFGIISIILSVVVFTAIAYGLIDRLKKNKNIVEKSKLNDWVSEANRVSLPHEAVRIISNIADNIADLEPNWKEIKKTPVGKQIEEICVKRLPRTIRLWEGIPQSLRNEKSLSLGATPASVLIQNLQSVEKGVKAIHSAAFDDTLSELNKEAILSDLQYSDPVI